MRLSASISYIGCAKESILHTTGVVAAIETGNNSEFVISNSRGNGVPFGFLYVETTRGVGVLEFVKIKGSTWVYYYPGEKNSLSESHDTEWMYSFLRGLVVKASQYC